MTYSYTTNTQMTYSNHSVPRLVVAALLFVMAVSPLSGKPAMNDYTDDDPLIVVCDIEFQPFEFRSDDGKPAGYNVELADMLLNELGIPHRFESRERVLATNMFNANEADLMLAPLGEKVPGIFYGDFPIASYRVGVAYKTGNVPISDIRQLGAQETIILKRGEYSANQLEATGLLDAEHTQYRTVKQGLYGVASDRYPYMVCGEQTMRAIMEKYHIDDVEIALFDIPATNIVFMSRDKALVEKLDVLCAQMEQEGKLDDLNDRWFGDGEENGIHLSNNVIVIIVAVLFLIVVLLLVRHVARLQVRKSMQDTIDLNNIIKKAIEMGKADVVSTDMKSMVLTNLYGNHLPYDHMSQHDNFGRIHPDDQPAMVELYEDFVAHKSDMRESMFRWNRGSNAHPDWRTCVGRSIPEYDKHGKLVHLVTTISDITDEQRKARDDRQRSEIFRHLFDMPLVGLALYDKDGVLVNANDAMLRMLGGIDNKQLAETRFFDLPCVRGNIDRKKVEPYYVCCMTDLTCDGKADYIDFRMRPVRDDNGELHYMMVTARNMREQRETMRMSRIHDVEIRTKGLEMQRYETELKYLLEQSHMTVWRSDFKKRTITLFKDLRTFDSKMTFDEYLSIVDPSSRSLAQKFIEPGDDPSKPLKGVLKMEDRIYGDGTPKYMSTNSIPDTDAEGNICGRFGLTRDIDDVMTAQEKMRREKERAEDSSRLKSVFLANMSHEIRTPLNAIVGFCDILGQIDDPEQRKEFLKIIDSNCSLLLQLIDDILIISEADAKGLTITPEDIDFTGEFSLLASSLASRVTNTDVKFIVDNPYPRLHAVVDKHRIQQVMTNFVTNAVKYTKQGHIKIGYSLVDDGIRLYCEDTGEGIPEDKTDKVFGRFVKLNDYVQGAGLGLSICKTIAECCNGKIGVESKLGKGSTFWMWLPCPTSLR